MKTLILAGSTVAASLVVLACGSPKPLGPTPLDEGIVVYVHAGFSGTSQQIGADVSDLGKVQGPCSTGEDNSNGSWNDCVSSVRVLPGWGATLYGDKDFKGASLEVTADVPDLAAVKGSCSGSYDDCISSIKVYRR